VSGIGTLNEGHLHASLKHLYAGVNGELEVPFGNFVADVVRDGVIYEIQTSSFSGLGGKMLALAAQRPVVLVHPIAQVKTLIKLNKDDSDAFTKRRSPKRGALVHIVRELVYIPALLKHPNFCVEAVLIEEAEVRAFDERARRGRGGWRGKGRQLIKVLDRAKISTPQSLLDFLLADLPNPFTTKDLSLALEQPQEIAQQMAYCLRHMEVVQVCGKRGNALCYKFCGDS
jgi:hypothetical protein